MIIAETVFTSVGFGSIGCESNLIRSMRKCDYSRDGLHFLSDFGPLDVRNASLEVCGKYDYS
jgi:hypothetical protein